MTHTPTEALRAALKALLDEHVDLINSGDVGSWDPEKGPEVIAARAALAQSPAPPVGNEALREAHTAFDRMLREKVIEECAKFVEQHQESIRETSNGSERYLSARKVGNLNGLAFVNGIRSLAPAALAHETGGGREEISSGNIVKEMRDLANEPIVTSPEGRSLLRKGADEIERLRLFAAPPAAPVSTQDWQPISTAPKDRFVLLYCPEDDSRWFAKWQNGEWYGSDCEHGIRRTGQSLNDPDCVTGWFVTLWRDVPAIPRADRGDAA